MKPVRVIHACLLILIVPFVHGCLFDPFFARGIRQTSLQMTSLEQRVVRLETVLVPGTVVSGTALPAAALSAGSISGASPVTGSTVGTLPSGAAIGSSAVSALPSVSGPALEVAGASATTGRLGLPGLPLNLREGMAKLTRGLVNVLTGWVEIPKRVHETSQTSGATAGFTYGLMRGFGYGFIRTAGGVYETVTFPFPAPTGFRPIMRPAYIFLCEEACPEP